MKIINKNLIVNEKDSKIILVADQSAAVLPFMNRDLEDGVRILSEMINDDLNVCIDAEDICSLHKPGKTITVASAHASGENSVQEVCRRAFLHMDTIHDACLLLTVPQMTSLSTIDTCMHTLMHHSVHPDATVIWGLAFSDDEEAVLEALIF